MKSLWNDDPSNFNGDYFSFDNVSFQPKPIQKQLPIWMGGNHNNAIERSVDYADGWQPIWFSAEELEPKIKYLNDYAEKQNKTLENFSISLRNRIKFTTKNGEGDENPPTALIGEKNEVFEKILSYKKLKINEVVLDFLTPEKDEIFEIIETLGNELIPEL